MNLNTTERIKFEYYDKRRVLEKSEGKCAHCGRPLTIKDTTVDHAIPISKGGTNDFDNLVALCDTCNSEKDDDIINPAAYFKYLKDEHKETLRTLHNAYCEDVSWLTPKQYIREDKIEIKYLADSGVLRGNLKKGGQYKRASLVPSIAILSKAKYSDLDEIKEYLKKYHKKYGLPTDYLDASISDVFSKGCIHMLKKGSEIIALFPVCIDKTSIDGEKNIYHLKYWGIPAIYHKYEYYELIKDCIRIINKGIVTANGKNIAVYSIAHYKDDDFLGSIIGDFAQYGKTLISNDDDGWDTVLFNQRWGHEGIEPVQPKEPEKDLEYFSTAIERIMRLAPANKKEKVTRIDTRRKKNTALRKEKKRMSMMIDEYDVRYY